MASQAQIEANRRNSQKSTGPATVSGKIASSQNALKTGAYAESLLIHGEAAETLDDLAREYNATCRPVGPREHAAVDALIHADWLLRRMRRVETRMWNDRIEVWCRSNNHPLDHEDAALVAWYRAEENLLRLQRRLTSLDRAYHRALSDLQRLQANRPPTPAPDPAPLPSEPPAPQIGFVPSPATVVVQCDPPEPLFPPHTARISPMLGHFPQPKALQIPSGVENHHIKLPSGAF